MGIFNTLFDIYGHDTLWAWYIYLVIGSTLTVAYFIYCYKQNTGWDTGDTVFSCALYFFGAIVIFIGVIFAILAVMLIILGTFYKDEKPISVGDTVISTKRGDGIEYIAITDNGDGSFTLKCKEDNAIPCYYSAHGDILKVVKRAKVGINV